MRHEWQGMTDEAVPEVLAVGGLGRCSRDVAARNINQLPPSDRTWKQQSVQAPAHVRARMRAGGRAGKQVGRVCMDVFRHVQRLGCSDDGIAHPTTAATFELQVLKC